MKLGEILKRTLPDKYIINKEDIKEKGKIPVLTAQDDFILGYTDDTEGVYPASEEHPVILFAETTTRTKYVTFPFKLKSRLINILTVKDELKDKVDLKYMYHLLKEIETDKSDRTRIWVQKYEGIDIDFPEIEEQRYQGWCLDMLNPRLKSTIKLVDKRYNYYMSQIFGQWERE